MNEPTTNVISEEELKEKLVLIYNYAKSRKVKFVEMQNPMHR